MARDRAARPEAKALRLFVGVEIPDAVRRQLETSVRPARGAFADARWVAAENWHVTVKFLGSTWPRLRPWIEEALASAAARSAPFETRLTGLGAFPSPGRARVLWAGLDDPDGAFGAVARSVDAVLAREFPPEKRPFTPHLTIARFRTEQPLPPDVLDVSVGSEPFSVGSFTLFRSHLQRPHARYEGLRRFDLG